MQIDLRRESRRRSKRSFSITWKDQDGLTHSARVTGTNESPSGMAFRCPFEIRPGTSVYLQAEDNASGGYSVVRHVAGRQGNYLIGLELDEQTKSANLSKPERIVDHYEFLQINPKAQSETIQRVYRFLAARYHPDNPETGDPEKFLRLNDAYEVLSDPELRARYDETLKANPA